MKASNRVQKNRSLENEKLMRILDRMQLDKPILMHDKLEIIWDGSSNDGNLLNLYKVQTKLDQIKHRRSK